MAGSGTSVRTSCGPGTPPFSFDPMACMYVTPDVPRVFRTIMREARSFSALDFKNALRLFPDNADYQSYYNMYSAWDPANQE